MIAKFESFHVGTLYSNEEIYGSLSTGNAGGIRIRTGASGEVERLAIFTSLPSARQLAENPYHDRIEGDVLTYTGAGRAGDQSVSGSNARILQQREKRFPTYGFQQVAGRRDKKVGNRRWAFLGLLEFMRCCRERQLDTEGAWRNVWVFELRIHPQPSVVEIVSERALTDAIFD